MKILAFPLRSVLEFEFNRLNSGICNRKPSKTPRKAMAYQKANAVKGASGRSCKVAVIGGGAAGLVAARELSRESHQVVVFERSEHVGGIWVYDPRIENDPLGLDPARSVVHSSMYASLRTNLPREIMAFFDYPFVVKEGRDSRRFPGHKEVALYLEDFAADYDILKFIRFKTEVEYVGMCQNNKWVVRSRVHVEDNLTGHRTDAAALEEIYDAVVVCNGHYTQPKIADIPGIHRWPGKQIHSHNFRVPDPFQDQVVIVIGNSASGQDISRELARVAKEVHLSARSTCPEVNMMKSATGYSKIWLHSMIDSAYEDGRVTFQDGASVFADTIIHCTGYSYHFPFLDTKGIVNVTDNRVGPLYEHVFPPLLAPSLSFVGLPWKVIPFPLCELQSKWIACTLSGKAVLPSEEDMMESVTDFYAHIEAVGLPKHHTHNIGHYQFTYDNWLANQCGYAHVEDWRKEIYVANSKNGLFRPETYRDEWEDHYWLEVALSAQSNRKELQNEADHLAHSKIH